jgi:hypothetical protein
MSAHDHVEQEPSGSSWDAPAQCVQVNQHKRRAVKKQTVPPPKATDAPTSNTQENDDDVSTPVSC